jgi:hypothetical protein
MQRVEIGGETLHHGAGAGVRHVGDDAQRARKLLGEGRAAQHGGGGQRRGAGLEDGSHGVLPGDPVHNVSFII